jgi:cobalt/nickel transport protein
MPWNAEVGLFTKLSKLTFKKEEGERMKIIILFLMGFMVSVMLCAPAIAHFQMVYTPEIALAKGGEMDLKIVFTHPFEAGYTMNMGTPEQFFVVHKAKKKDLLNTLKPITWTSLTNSGKAYETSYKLRGMGDWIFCLTPAPYFEEADGIYIQQITKTIVNVAGLPTDWKAEVGLPAEIVPLNKPYNMLTGNVFRGIVTSNGKPVPFAEIEVEYMNHTPQMDKNAFAAKENAQTPPTFGWPTTVSANAQGEFSYGIPKSGFWGFCALGVGPAKEFKGKELSQDAVIWIQAVDMK